MLSEIHGKFDMDVDEAITAFEPVPSKEECKAMTDAMFYLLDTLLHRNGYKHGLFIRDDGTLSYTIQSPSGRRLDMRYLPNLEIWVSVTVDEDNKAVEHTYQANEESAIRMLLLWVLER